MEKKQKWTKPLLMILSRAVSQESVLEVCKNYIGGGGSSQLNSEFSCSENIGICVGCSEASDT